MVRRFAHAARILAVATALATAFTTALTTGPGVAAPLPARGSAAGSAADPGAAPSAPGATRAGRRLALVVGNARYAHAPALPNAAGDARATREVLAQAGFEVVEAEDATLEQFRAALDAFARALDAAGPGAIATVYYAGHAVQLNGTNYLLPVDLAFTAVTDVAGGGVSLDEITRRLDATAAGAKVVILDACRNNPFREPGRPAGLAASTSEAADARGLEATGSVERGGGEAGLARVTSRGGTLVAFSTSPGATALDGEGEHSPFTAAFLRHVRQPGLPVEQLFREVRVSVSEATEGGQLPWETSSLTRSFSYFAAPEAAAGAARPAGGADPAARPPTREALRAAAPAEALRLVTAWDDPASYRLFLEVYPDDALALRVHRILAARLEELAWASAVRDGAAALRTFRGLYAASAHAGESLALEWTARRDAALRTASLCARPAPSTPAPPAPRARRAEAAPIPAPLPAPAPARRTQAPRPAPRPAAARAAPPAAESAPIPARRRPVVEIDEGDLGPGPFPSGPFPSGPVLGFGRPVYRPGPRGPMPPRAPVPPRGPGFGQGGPVVGSPIPGGLGRGAMAGMRPVRAIGPGRGFGGGFGGGLGLFRR